MNKADKNGQSRILILAVMLTLLSVMLWISANATQYETGYANETAQVFTVVEETTTPNVTLISPANNSYAAAGTVTFYYNVTDRQWSNITNCSLILNGVINQTINNINYSYDNYTLLPDITQNFTVTGMTKGNYSWYVNCTEYRNPLWDNTSFSKTGTTSPWNLTLLDPVSQITSLNVSMEGSSVKLVWNSAPDATWYHVYRSVDQKPDGTYEMIANVTDLNYTDTTPRNREFYKIEAGNFFSTNMSDIIGGKNSYELRRVDGSYTRNWIAIPLNDSTIENASNLLAAIPNATSITMRNRTSQTSVFCNTEFCPATGCTQTNCDFKLEPGHMYQVNINGSGPLLINWTLTGTVIDSVSIPLSKVEGGRGLNWIAVAPNTTLTNAQSLITNITNATTLSRWNNSLQRTEGRIKIGHRYIGRNFQIDAFEGYVVNVKSNSTWEQT
ncbi:hypothetical protein D6745_00905 [Candidatus Woesearchaeota archaeon]|nr:MAG: hypothetical protein D6745_00905 [Candidatus Woesearchaeota archaeon]